MAKRRMWIFTLFLFLADMLLFNLAALLAFLVRASLPTFKTTLMISDFYFKLWIFSNFIFIIMFNLYSLYKQKRSLFDADEFTKIFLSLFYTFLIVAAVTFVTRTGIVFSRALLLIMFIFALVLITLSRLFFRTIQGYLREEGFNFRNAVILGHNETAKEIHEKIQNPKLGYSFHGFIDDKFRGAIAKIDDLGKVIKKHSIDIVFITTSNNKIFDIVTRYDNVQFKIVPAMLNFISEPISFDEFKDIPLLVVDETSYRKGYLIIKRFLDIIFSFILLIILSPFFIIISILIDLTSERPIFFKQKRMGRNNKTFTLYKFRTMHNNAKKVKRKEKGLFYVDDDDRITNIGKLLRRFSIDELPQLYNILKGDMSFVGPRPHLKEELKDYEIAGKKRLSLRPGMTGLWQVSGRHKLNLKTSALLDLYYVKHVSFWLDLKIILKTIPAILFNR